MRLITIMIIASLFLVACSSSEPPMPKFPGGDLGPFGQAITAANFRQMDSDAASDFLEAETVEAKPEFKLIPDVSSDLTFLPILDNGDGTYKLTYGVEHNDDWVLNIGLLIDKYSGQWSYFWLDPQATETGWLTSDWSDQLEVDLPEKLPTIATLIYTCSNVTDTEGDTIAYDCLGGKWQTLPKSLEVAECTEPAQKYCTENNIHDCSDKLKLAITDCSPLTCLNPETQDAYCMECKGPSKTCAEDGLKLNLCGEDGLWDEPLNCDLGCFEKEGADDHCKECGIEYTGECLDETTLQKCGAEGNYITENCEIECNVAELLEGTPPKAYCKECQTLNEKICLSDSTLGVCNENGVFESVECGENKGCKVLSEKAKCVVTGGPSGGPVFPADMFES